MEIKKATYLTGVADISQIKESFSVEIAIAGKSNVGKSSFINFICNNSKLAKTSKEPGRTRLLNFFKINDGEFYFVDLPGYGFAKVNDKEKERWGKITEEYFQKSTGLKNIFLLLDIRHDPTDNDVQMLKYMYFYNIPFTIICTKTDKLSRAATLRRKKEIADYLGIGVGNILTCSSLEKKGKEEIYLRIEQILNN